VQRVGPAAAVYHPRDAGGDEFEHVGRRAAGEVLHGREEDVADAVAERREIPGIGRVGPHEGIYAGTAVDDECPRGRLNDRLVSTEAAVERGDRVGESGGGVGDREGIAFRAAPNGQGTEVARRVGDHRGGQPGDGPAVDGRLAGDGVGRVVNAQRGEAGR